jgi:signal peptidase I
VQPIRLLRYAYLVGFFGVLPIVGAMVLVRLLAPSDTYMGTGAVAWVLTLFRDQRAPATIVLFTILEVTLWNQRQRLPWAELLSSGERNDIPSKYRASYDRGAAILDDAERIVRLRRKAVERELSAAERDTLQESLDALRAAMTATPFRGSVLDETLERAEDEVEAKLGRWRKGELREYAESIGVAIGVAILLRVFVVEAFKIPSGSMIPTLQVGDHIFVNKMSFGPMVPWLNKRLFARLPPKRGDVIVFEFPENREQDFIKRVIAAPGDRLEVKDGHPILNGWKVPFCNVGTFTYRETSTSPPHRAELDVEFLEERAYLTLYERSYAGGGEMQGPYFVKSDEVWVLGDNRNNSHDSRGWFEGRGGGVPPENLKGRAMFVWLSVDNAGAFAWDRLGVNVMGDPVLPKGTDPAIVAGLEKCMKNRPSLTQSTPPPRAP